MFTESGWRPQRYGFRYGSLFFHGYPNMAECLVWATNDVGATIEVGDDVEVPADFRLIAVSLKINRGCRVVWRDDRRIGVEFVRGSQPA